MASVESDLLQEPTCKKNLSVLCQPLHDDDDDDDYRALIKRLARKNVSASIWKNCCSVTFSIIISEWTFWRLKPDLREK
jgi:hypothetical protein